jgi:hypothetical protein
MPHLKILLLLLLLSVVKSQVATRFECSNGCAECIRELNTCKKCGPNYYFDHNYRICVFGLQQGCLIYHSYNICLTCDSGFKNEGGVCKRCDILRCNICATSIKTCM